MDIKQINWDKLKTLSDKERTKAIADYNEEKELLILEYMKLQDIIDEYNQHIYQITCKIEQINQILKII